MPKERKRGRHIHYATPIYYLHQSIFVSIFRAPSIIEFVKKLYQWWIELKFSNNENTSLFRKGKSEWCRLKTLLMLLKFRKFYPARPKGRAAYMSFKLALAALFPLFVLIQNSRNESQIGFALPFGQRFTIPFGSRTVFLYFATGI